MKRKYYKFTPEYMVCLKYAGLCPLGCEYVKYASHRARKRDLYNFGKRRPHSHRMEIFPYYSVDIRKLKRMARKHCMTVADLERQLYVNRYVQADGRTIRRKDNPPLYYALRAQYHLPVAVVPSVP